MAAFDPGPDHACPNCFAQAWLRDYVKEESTRRGKCPSCGSRNQPLVPVYKLYETFNDLISSYEPAEGSPMERGEPIVMLVQDEHEVFSEQLVDLNREGPLLEAIMHSGWDDDSGDPLLSAYDHYVGTPWYRIQEVEPSPALTLKTLLIPGGSTDHGLLVRAVAVPWFEILRILRQDPAAAYQIDWRMWEEIIAGAYTRAGFDEVILTPRSGDGGKDIIATKLGVGSVRIFDQVKAYKPSHLVDADEVRSMLGVITAHQNVSKGIITTTSDFAPRVLDDPTIAPFVPYRLELKPREPLLTWLRELSDTKD